MASVSLKTESICIVTVARLRIRIGANLKSFVTAPHCAVDVTRDHKWRKEFVRLLSLNIVAHLEGAWTIRLTWWFTCVNGGKMRLIFYCNVQIKQNLNVRNILLQSRNY